MCVIIAGANNRPSLAELLACERRNPDGAGLAWLNDDDTVSFRKGITAEEMHAMLRRLPKATPFVGHFRWATVGEPSPELCHPFPVGRRTSLATKRDHSKGRVLFHNGTWSGWRSVLNGASNLPAGEWSDSRALAYALGNGSDELLDEVPCKFAVMGSGALRLYPSDLGGWSSRRGVMYSNLNWTGELRAGKGKSGRKKINGIKGITDLFDDRKRPEATTKATPNKPRRLGQAK
jgi:hypothetical protein